ncbi:MAG: hypothetical protein COY40_01930 [Alphaproteobacteria bacterium CG_4_10_14_0_8_um_filter_53_9]|nr:MAG: hypothetical protein COY40_01930 [Alphaproteobacteria bacterium CG_4_10_14_0_8_um_filter_53_9]
MLMMKQSDDSLEDAKLACVMGLAAALRRNQVAFAKFTLERHPWIREVRCWDYFAFVAIKSRNPKLILLIGAVAPACQIKWEKRLIQAIVLQDAKMLRAVTGLCHLFGRIDWEKLEILALQQGNTEVCAVVKVLACQPT